MTRLASTVLTMALVLVACTRENPNAPDPALESDLGGEAQQRELETVQSWAAMPDGGIAALAGNTIAAAVHVPAGSVDALQAAIAAAGPNGTVILDAGNHSESNTVLVTHKVAILGEPGAILTSDVDHYGITGFLKPALHVRGADHVKIWGLDMRPADAIGGTAILLEDSDHALVANNEMHAFQYVVMLEQAHQARIQHHRVQPGVADGRHHRCTRHRRHQWAGHIDCRQRRVAGALRDLGHGSPWMAHRQHRA